jgi:hypothetical protein
MGVEACTCDECEAKNAVAERDALRVELEETRRKLGDPCGECAKERSRAIAERDKAIAELAAVRKAIAAKDGETTEDAARAFGERSRERLEQRDALRRDLDALRNVLIGRSQHDGTEATAQSLADAMAEVLRECNALRVEVLSAKEAANEQIGILTARNTRLADSLAAATSRADNTGVLASLVQERERAPVSRDTLIVLAQRVGESWCATRSESLLVWSEETGAPMIAKALGLEVA